MIFGSAGLVTSSTVIQVALPKSAVISLEPLIVIGPVTVGGVGPGARAGRGDRDRVAEDQRRQVDGKLALAVGRGHQHVGVGAEPRSDPPRFGLYGPARSGMPVLGSMLPSDRLSEVTETWGRLPPSATAP